MSIRHSILALLQEQPRHGYQLRAEFESRVGAVWPLIIGLTAEHRPGLYHPGRKDTAANQRPADSARLLVLDSLIFQAEAEIRWLDLCEARLGHAM
ncbi:PadR family transcriptional regulator [Arthrobacter cavernae]|uniref:Helix-turn-helix transcriptional regulator n=1 Tax=Arthrobacter cavernae TaxID=2817681 RepID=A0A939HIB9_9MICC|nr:helix-turn-helix transcriptional regulator [Arthrobacter cavernae]MBO1268803.1 helix-turn-helix transcriptional regulator [Arthrobacter cavernae]